MKKYPKYKDSGIEWIGEIPEHWNAAKIKYSDKIIMGQSPKSEDYNTIKKGLPFLQGNADFNNLFPTPRIWCNTSNKIANKDDILLSVRAPIGAVNIAEQDYGIGRGLCAIRAVTSLSKILFYFALALNDELNKIGRGSTFTAISVDDIENIFIPEIPLDEQKSILYYLDQKTKQIDSLIEKKQKLIELLKEKRTAIINQAVTKGLDPNVPMKDSGIEWLGEIPEHWGKYKLSRISEIKGRIGWRGYTVNDLRDKEDGVIVIGATQIDNNGKIDLSKPTYLSLEKYEESPEIKLYGNEILLVKVGATIGKVGFVPKDIGNATINPNVMIVRNSSLLPEYLFYYLRSLPVQISMELAKSAGAQDAINQEFVKSIWIPIPPNQEQEEIVNHVLKETNIIDKTIKKQNKLIEQIKEYRTTLISEVVTGKIDVRNEVES